jgi:AraC-like DNA-binding protein
MDLIKRSQPAPVRFPDYGIYALESHHENNFVMEPVAHDYWKLLYVKAGRGVLCYDKARLELTPDTPVFVPAGLTHFLEDDRDAPLSLYLVCVDMDCLPPAVSRQLELRPLSTLGAVHNKHPWHIHFQRLLYEQTMGRPDRCLVLLESVLWMLCQFSRTPLRSAPSLDKSQDRVRRMAERMEQTFFEPNNLDDAAREAGLGPRRFSQLFRAVTGQSWLDYLRALRIRHARLLLSQTDRSVTSIAFECGFGDVSNFYRAFRQATGLSPVVVRDAARAGNNTDLG